MKNVELANQIITAINHPVREKIVELLERHELNVTEIQKKINIEQAMTSHHLGVLKNAKLLKSKRNGKCVYYTTNDGMVLALRSFLGEIAW
ncbi:MAG: helix-turn-helix transcriptional regulator [Bacteroidetes bacterium]|nr:helix-turn-helix transcriptional regulator [Bacteroidota bacterium]